MPQAKITTTTTATEVSSEGGGTPATAELQILLARTLHGPNDDLKLTEPGGGKGTRGD